MLSNYKSILVYGHGITGRGVESLLNKNNKSYHICDSKFKKNYSIYKTEEYIMNNIRNYDLIIVSPGITSFNEIIKIAISESIKVISEIELAYYFCEVPIIAITGTNGKSSLCNIIHEIFTKSNIKSYILGNIGKSFAEKVSELEKDSIVILEVSAGQLEFSENFKPYISIITNIKPEHLNMYQTTEYYASLKHKIYSKQDHNDYLIINEDISLLNMHKTKVMKVDKNNFNLKVVEQISKILNIDLEVALETLEGFEGLEHAQENFLSFKNFNFFNDSKATNHWSTIYAIQNMENNIILISGGKNDKNADYLPLVEEIKNSVYLTIFIEETGKMIFEQFKNEINCCYVNSLEEVMLIIEQHCKDSELYDILFSPSANSGQLFENHKVRGERFKNESYKFQQHYSYKVQ